ncbi:MAG: IS1634 family transposase [Victivallaceae bacterium]
MEVFSGNTSDQTTVMNKIDTMRREFKINEMIFVGDRGMLTAARRNDLQEAEYEAVKYISALTRREFFEFLDDQDHPLQLTLFDKKNLVEVSHEGVRYVLSFNPDKELEDRQVRLRLIAKTQEKLEMIQRNVENGNWKEEKVIAKKLHAWINKWRMARFFTVEYSKGRFSFSRNEEIIEKYEAIDGFYVITSDVVEEVLDTANLRFRYKSLIQVEQAFRSTKTTELFILPIRHWNPERVKGHIFLCMLSYLIIWKARKLFAGIISGEPAGEATKQTDCHSLRIIWERLNQWMQIGKLKINGETKEQLNPLTNEAKKILELAGASLTKKRKEYLFPVG